MLGLQLGTVLFVLLAAYLLAQLAGLAVKQARALTFSAMIVGDIWLIFINRSWSLPLHASVMLPNPVLWLVVLCALLMLGLALFVPVMNTLFHFGTPPIGDLGLMIAIISGILLLTASVRKRGRNNKH